ncbi:DUF4012 domain-containing protein [Candidatus Kuenenbacteria bacterium]|nr:DUF4012 domain-containing protein [Candidatus Kuenenbacteria bacterium]
MPKKATKTTKQESKKARKQENKKGKKQVSRKKTTKKATKDHLSIGLLQHEIDGILDKQPKEKTDEKLEKSIMKELAALLPDNEKVSKKHEDKHTNILVQSMSRRAEHSPFVLDLTEMIKKKKKEHAAKKRVTDFFKQPIFKKQITELKLKVKEIESTVGEEIHKDVIIVSESVKSAVRPRAHGRVALAPLNPHQERVVIAEYEEPIAITEKLKIKADKQEEQFTRKPWHYHFNLPLYWHRSIIAYVAICLLLVAPIKVFGHFQEMKKTQGQIVSYAVSAYEDLKIASKELAASNIENAEKSFSAATYSFEQASQELGTINIALKAISTLIPMDRANVADAEYMLRIGKNVSELGTELPNVLESLTSKDPENSIDALIPKINQINNDLHKIRLEAIPENNRAQFENIRDYVSLLAADLKELNSLSKTINQILGSDYKRRYLFVFQNNNELRPTGGFMGSFALVDIDRGKIVNMEIPGGGTYDMQGSLIEKRISPYPMHVINSLWEMQDANWFPDFPTSAEKIKWFYEKSGGPTVDGVIALNANLIPELMKITGDIYVPEVNKTFRAAGFTEQLQETIEENKNSKQPKKVLSLLAPKLLDKIFNAEGNDLIEVIKTIKVGLDQKDIQMYFSNSAIQEKISSYAWTGEILNSSKDYLAVINTNIGGGKTDYYIEQNIDLQSDIQDNGDVINTVTVTRTHTGNSENSFSSKNNLNFIRIYTPVGSQLISTTGYSEIPAEMFEPAEEYWETDQLLTEVQGKVWIEPKTGTYINNEFNKTVFGNWLEIDPEETGTVVFKYKLPFKFDLKQKESWIKTASSRKTDFYSLFIQKQSGQQNTEYNVNINLPEGVSVDWLYPPLGEKYGSKIEFQTGAKQDELIAFVIK